MFGDEFLGIRTFYRPVKFFQNVFFVFSLMVLNSRQAVGCVLANFFFLLLHYVFCTYV